MTIPTTARPRAVLAVAAACAAAAALAACSGSSAASSAASSVPTGGGRGASRGFGPAAAGVIAAISGKTLQVQSSTDQTAVTYTAETAFTEQQTVRSSRVAVGSCILATAAPTTSGTSTGSPAGASSGSAAGPSTPLAATRIEVLGPSTGTTGCGSGAAFGPGTRSGRPSGLPSGVPGATRSRSGSYNGPRGFADRVAGTVTAVTGSTITVSEPAPRGSGGSATTTRTVITSGSTVYLETGTVTSAAIEVGLCATVQGSTGSTGAVTATRIALTQKVGATCNSGFGRGFGAARPAAGGTATSG